MPWLFASGGQRIGASASTSVLPMNIHGLFPLGLTFLVSLLSKGLSRVFSNTSSKTSILWQSAFIVVQLSHLHMATGKTIALVTWTFVGKMATLLCNTVSRFYHNFSFKKQMSFYFMASVTVHSVFGAQENKICHCFLFPIYLP